MNDMTSDTRYMKNENHALAKFAAVHISGDLMTSGSTDGVTATFATYVKAISCMHAGTIFFLLTISQHTHQQ